jgi:hypothetical protein
VRSSHLARLASNLPDQRRSQLANELQALYVRQAVAEGGSFLLNDLQRSARSVEAYVLLGLRAESGGRADAETLEGRPLNKLAHSGARLVEALRQVALRLQPLGRILDTEGRALVESLVKPRLTLDAAGEPRLQLRPGGSLPEYADLETAGSMLQRLVAWSDLGRGLGLDRTAEALVEAGSLAALQELLAVGAVLFGRLELGLAEAADRRRFAARYVGPEHTLQPSADEGLRKAAESWGRERGADAVAIVALLHPALERLAVE